MDNQWIDTAPCRGATRVFFPPGDRPKSGRPTKRIVDPWAKARPICAACPHREDCLERALELEAEARGIDRHGYAGGMTPGERWAEQHRRDDLPPPDARHLDPDDPMHGTLTGAIKHRCPCERCHLRKTDYMAAWRDRNRDHLNAAQRAYNANRRGAA